MKIYIIEMYNVSKCKILYFHILGAAPIATLNLQHCGEGCDIPDAWHHQMIFGVGQAGIYLTNPLECLPEQVCMIDINNTKLIIQIIT